MVELAKMDSVIRLMIVIPIFMVVQVVVLLWHATLNLTTKPKPLQEEGYQEEDKEDADMIIHRKMMVETQHSMDVVVEEHLSHLNIHIITEEQDIVESLSYMENIKNRAHKSARFLL